MKVVTYGLGGYDPDKPNGNIVEELDVPVSPTSLDAAGALATLLVVQGVVDINDAANAVGLVPEELIHEAQAWAVAEGLNNG